MKSKRLIIAIICLFYFNVIYAKKNMQPLLEEKTMCYPFEEIYFSCRVAGEIVSVCASGNISPKNGYVKYRFGNPGKIELEFPPEPDPPMDNFSIGDFQGKGENTIKLAFKSGRYIYTVYQNSKSGVYVTKNKQVIRHLKCGDGHYSQISPRAKRGIKNYLMDAEAK